MKKNLNENKNEMDNIFKKWIGGSSSEDLSNEQNIPEEQSSITSNIAEENEPYVDLSPVSVVVKLPFEAKEGDELDINAIIKKINEDGSVEIEINKAFNKNA